MVSTKLGVTRVDLVISIKLCGSSFSMCSHKPGWIHGDKQKLERLSLYYHWIIIDIVHRRICIIKITRMHFKHSEDHKMQRVIKKVVSLLWD